MSNFTRRLQICAKKMTGWGVGTTAQYFAIRHTCRSINSGTMTVESHAQTLRSIGSVGSAIHPPLPEMRLPRRGWGGLQTRRCSCWSCERLVELESHSTYQAPRETPQYALCEPLPSSGSWQSRELFSKCRSVRAWLSLGRFVSGRGWCSQSISPFFRLRLRLSLEHFGNP
jgi:hypothetical protein